MSAGRAAFFAEILKNWTKYLNKYCH